MISIFRFLNMVASRSMWVLLAIFWVAAQTNAKSVFAEQQPVSPKELHLASIGALAPGINPEDARLALEIIIQKTLLRKTDPFRVTLSIITDFNQTRSSIAQKHYQFLALTGSDYAELSRFVTLTPLLILSKHDLPTETLLLVSKKHRDLKVMAENDKRVVAIDGNRTGEMSQIWLDTVLWQSGYPSSEQFFTTIKRANKTSQVLLPVFFGQADACVITADAFALMAEFNPQIEKQLVPLTHSPGLVSMLLCATEYAAPEDRNLLLSEAHNAEQEPNVQQALTIVQMKRFIPFQPTYFKATEALIENHRQMKRQQKGGS